MHISAILFETSFILNERQYKDHNAGNRCNPVRKTPASVSVTFRVEDLILEQETC
jgi:hypothetical protein